MKAALRLLAFVVASGWPTLASGAEFPVPPTPTHYVTDIGGALSQGARAKIESTLGKYEKATGNQLVVYIAGTTGGVPLEDWTGTTADTWKIGRRKNDNGAVLFLFTRDKRVRIEVGYGLESALTDADSKRIIDTQIVPRMKDGDIDDAIGDGVNGMIRTISPDYAIPPPSQPPQTADDGSDDPTFWWSLLFIAFVIFVVVWSQRGKKGRGGYWSGGFGGGSLGGGSFGSGGGGFSAGGGGFGGGGASGGW